MNIKKSVIAFILAASLGAGGCVAYPRYDHHRDGYYDRRDGYRDGYDSFPYYQYNDDYNGPYRHQPHHYYGH